MYRKELAYYFSTPIAYIVIGLYLVAISLFLWVIPSEWNIIDSGYAQTDGLFRLSPWMFMFLCPALTMRLVCEERLSGTWDLLRTKKCPIWRILVDKYLAAWTLVFIGLMPCLTHYFVVWWMAEPMGNIDFGAFVGAWLGLLLLSGTFLAVGLLAGCWSRNQIVAFLCAAVACFVLYWTLFADYYASLSRGVIDMRDIVFFLSVIVMALLATILVLERISYK